MNEPTRYELVAIAPNGGRYLAGYCRVPSRSSAVRMLRQHGKEWTELWGDAPTKWTGKGRFGWALECAGWTIRYSQRTKLECQGSELPFFKTYK
jgi:hypothetical protein